MAEFKKIKKIPTTISDGKGKNMVVYTHFQSLKTLKAANESKAQVKSQFKKVVIERQILSEDKIYSLYIIKND